MGGACLIGWPQAPLLPDRGADHHGLGVLAVHAVEDPGGGLELAAEVVLQRGVPVPRNAPCLPAAVSESYSNMFGFSGAITPRNPNFLASEAGAWPAIAAAPPPEGVLPRAVAGSRPRLLAFHDTNPLLRRPPLDEQQRRLRVQPRGGHLGNVGKEQVPGRAFLDRPGENRPPGDLRLARPLGLLALLRVNHRAVPGEPRAPPQSPSPARPRHRPHLHRTRCDPH